MRNSGQADRYYKIGDLKPLIGRNVAEAREWVHHRGSSKRTVGGELVEAEDGSLAVAPDGRNGHRHKARHPPRPGDGGILAAASDGNLCSISRCRIWSTSF